MPTDGEQAHPESDAPRLTFPLPPTRRSLHEILADPDETVGFVLWHAIRRVRDWLDTSPGDREEAWREPRVEVQESYALARAAHPQIARSLATFYALSRTPLLASPRRLARACWSVVSWATDAGLKEIAIQFAELAGELEPEVPYHANRAGKVCRRAGELNRASLWYLRGAALATTRRNTDQYILAHLGAGALCADLGQLEEARQHFEKVVKRSRSRNRRKRAGQALHYLMAIADAEGNYAEVEASARGALEWYPVRHPRVPNLALDYSFALLRYGMGERAFALLAEVDGLIADRSEQVVFWGNLAWAAAIAGQHRRFRHAADRVAEMVPTYDEYGAAACINVARGAWQLGDRDMAAAYATTSLEMAIAKRDAIVESVARSVIDDMEARVSPQPRQPPPGNDADWIVREMILRLRRWAEGRGKPRE
jgi:tetratricopeptide (TPR) repeat protein